MDADDPIFPYCAPFAEPHACFRAFLLAHPDADGVWMLAEDGTTDLLMDDRTVRTFLTGITPVRKRQWSRLVAPCGCMRSWRPGGAPRCRGPRCADPAYGQGRGALAGEGAQSQAGIDTSIKVLAPAAVAGPA